VTGTGVYRPIVLLIAFDLTKDALVDPGETAGLLYIEPLGYDPVSPVKGQHRDHLVNNFPPLQRPLPTAPAYRSLQSGNSCVPALELNCHDDEKSDMTEEPCSAIPRRLAPHLPAEQPAAGQIHLGYRCVSRLNSGPFTQVIYSLLDPEEVWTFRSQTASCPENLDADSPLGNRHLNRWCSLPLCSKCPAGVPA
jgi:hypothetical protein